MRQKHNRTGSDARDLTGRVAVVSHSHPSISKGGGEIAAYSLFRGLLEIGVDAIFISPCPETEQGRLHFETEREHAIPYSPAAYEHFYHLSHPETVKKFHDCLRSNNVQVVNYHHFFNLGLGSLSRWESGPRPHAVFTFHEFLAICHHHGQMVTRPNMTLCNTPKPSACATCYPELTPQQFAVRRENFLTALNGCGGLISPSRFLADRMEAWGVNSAPIEVIENGLRTLPPRVPRKADKAPDEPWVIGFFGQINPFKGVDLLLQAAAILREKQDEGRRVQIRLHGNIVGQGEAFTKKFYEETQAADSIIRWQGAYDNSQVGRLMGDCDYVIVPSKWWENSPVVIQEAFAVGRPVICTGIGGMAEKVQDGVSGLHFSMNDAFDLAAVVEKACSPETYRKLCSGLPTPFDSSEMARRYKKYFEKVVSALPIAV
jgi:glycosyltransferase involved in cell wall biosynthesis